MKEAREGGIALLFMDAAHFVMGCDFLGCIYGLTRRFVKTFSGRKRYNVLGALNYITKKVTTVTNNTYITATEICELLKKVSIEYAGKKTHIILDNARYQKCAVVQTLAEQLGITLDFIPPYSPNINLVERLWKFVKTRLRTKYYNDFGVFCGTIDGLVASTEGVNKDIIEKLIGEKVQLFDNLETVNENTYKIELRPAC